MKTEHEEEGERYCDQDDREEDKAETIDDSGSQHPVMPQLRLLLRPGTFLVRIPASFLQKISDAYQDRIGRRFRECRDASFSAMIDERSQVGAVFDIIHSDVGVRRLSCFVFEAQQRCQPLADNSFYLEIASQPVSHQSVLCLQGIQKPFVSHYYANRYF